MVGHVRQTGKYVPQICIGVQAAAPAVFDEGVNNSPALAGIDPISSQRVAYLEQPTQVLKLLVPTAGWFVSHWATL